MTTQWNKWPKIRFADICKHSAFGPRFSGELYAVDGNVATLRTTDIREDGRIEYLTMPLAKLDLSNLQQHILLKGDLVITRSGRVGTTAVFEEFRLPVLPGAFLIRFRVKPEIADPHFYKYYFNSPEGHDQVISTATGSVQQNLNITSLHMLEVPIPPLPIQQAIVSILGSLDDMIEIHRRMNKTLEAKGKAIFRSWFVDFDPVRAKVERRENGHLRKIDALFPDEFEEIEGREVPRGWKVGSLSESFDIKMGQSPPGITYNETGDGIPFFQGRTDFGFRYPSTRVYCTAPTRFAEIGDTLVSVRAPVGDINLTKEKCCIGRGVAAVRHKTGSRSFTYYQMLALKEIFALFESEGTVFGAINKTDFNSLECIIVPENIITKFEEIVYPIDQMIENNEQQARSLVTIRDSLLPRLMSGEIPVQM